MTSNGSEPIADTRPATLFEFPHGLGDLIQFSVILKHLAKAQPDIAVDVCCGEGKHLSGTLYERQRYHFGSPLYDRSRYQSVVWVDWGDCMNDVDGLPSTKTYQCLTQLLHLEPAQELFTYQITITDDDDARACAWLKAISGVELGELGVFPVVLIHYQGVSSRMSKDLPTEVVSEVVEFCRARSKTVALLDNDRQSPLVNQTTVFCPLPGHPVWRTRTHCDPATAAALIRRAEAFIGIDSGPLHLAGALTTPTLGVWTHHHPIRFFDFSSNVVHLLPAGSQRLAPGPRALRTFEERYRHTTYVNMRNAICEQLEAILSGTIAAEPASEALPGLRSTAYNEDYYREHLLGGLDYLGHGDWQRSYGLWLAEAMDWKGKRVLDVGCACGSIMRGLGEAGIVVEGFDLSEYLVQLGRDKWPDMSKLLHVADAINLHLWQDESWDGLHSNQVAEHWRPDLVPFILAELARVTKPGGLFLCILDTAELFERHGRTLDNEDPTHICIKTREWWQMQFNANGWDDVTAKHAERLGTHLKSFLKQYDWEFFVSQRIATSEGK